MGRRGITPEASKAMVRRSNTTIAALMVHLGDADAMLCGLVGRFDSHLKILNQVLGTKRGAPGFATLNALTLDKYTLFIADTNVHEDPSAETLANIAVMAADEVRRFGLPPKVAFLVALQLRLVRARLGAQDAAGARPVRAHGARCRMRRRDARRLGPVRRSAPQHAARQHPHRIGQPPDLPQPGRRQYPVQRAQDDRRQRHHGRPHPVGRSRFGPRADALSHGGAGWST